MEALTIIRILIALCWLVGIVSAVIAKKRYGGFESIAMGFVFGLIAIPGVGLVILFIYSSFMVIFFGSGTH